MTSESPASHKLFPIHIRKRKHCECLQRWIPTASASAHAIQDRHHFFLLPKVDMHFTTSTRRGPPLAAVCRRDTAAQTLVSATQQRTEATAPQLTKIICGKITTQLVTVESSGIVTNTFRCTGFRRRYCSERKPILWFSPRRCCGC